MDAPSGKKAAGRCTDSDRTNHHSARPPTVAVAAIDSRSRKRTSAMTERTPDTTADAERVGRVEGAAPIDTRGDHADHDGGKRGRAGMGDRSGRPGWRRRRCSRRARRNSGRRSPAATRRPRQAGPRPASSPLSTIGNGLPRRTVSHGVTAPSLRPERACRNRLSPRAPRYGDPIAHRSRWAP